jgi:hypothetical protein
VFSLERSLRDRLREHSVRIEIPDTNTACFRGVPANPRFFNKPTTNVLVKRPHQGLPFVVCVDEDLEYRGADNGVAGAFAKGRLERGWRVLFVSAAGHDDLQPIIERALTAVGFGGDEPRLDPMTPAGPRAAGWFARVAVDLTAAVSAGAAEPCVGRAHVIDEVCVRLLKQRPDLPVIAAPPGIGKTNLLHGVACRLAEARPDLRLVSLDLGVVLSGTVFPADRENLLAALLGEARQSHRTIVALEHFELGCLEAPHGAWQISQALEQGARLIGTTLPGFWEPLQVPPLASRLHRIDLSELPLAATSDVLTGHLTRIAGHHRVSVSGSMIDAAVDAACAIDGPLPAKALALLDRAAAWAALAGRPAVTLGDLHGAIGAMRGRS